MYYTDAMTGTSASAVALHSATERSGAERRATRSRR